MRAGLIMNLKKTGLWWPRQPEAYALQLYPRQILEEREEDGQTFYDFNVHGIDVLGAPVGSSMYQQEAVRQRVAKAVHLMGQLDQLVNKQAALTLLRQCLSTCKIVHLLRTVPQVLCREQAHMFSRSSD